MIPAVPAPYNAYWTPKGCDTDRQKRRWRSLRAIQWKRGQIMPEERETITLAELERRKFAWDTSGAPT